MDSSVLSKEQPMPGAGVRVFLPGEVLTASLVNAYLQDQSVCRFANAAARSAAFGGEGQPVLEEGRVSYLDSTDELAYYDGDAWVAINSEAVINLIEAKGDMVVGTGINTLTRLAVGTNGYVLTADSSAGSGLAWTSVGIDDGSITTAKIADSAVTAVKISNASITNAKIADSAAIDIGKIADVSIVAKTANHTLVLTDKNKLIEFNLASNHVLTVPTNAVVPFPIGSQITVVCYGTGRTQVVGDTGVTVRATPGTFLRTQYSSAVLIKRDTNEWYLLGDVLAQ
jgi:sporulation protein YlmC with PRC-barrel domain